MKILTLIVLSAAVGCGGSSTAKLPVLNITAPSGGALVTLGADKSAPMSYTVSDFAVKPVGACGSLSTSCGHVHVLIDGTACNPPNSPYNGTGETAGSAVAKFALCAMPTGKHTVTLELHDDAHNPINSTNGQVIQASVAFTTQ